MNFKGLINAICDDGDTSVRLTCSGDKLEGALQGFLESRMTLDPDDLQALVESSTRDVEQARHRRDPKYWYWRYRALQIEWCANVVSAALYSNGLPVIVPPTYRGFLKAADILGINT